MLGNLGPTYRRFGGELHRPIARVEDTVELWLQLTTQAEAQISIHSISIHIPPAAGPALCHCTNSFALQWLE